MRDTNDNNLFGSGLTAINKVRKRIAYIKYNFIKHLTWQLVTLPPSYPP